MGKAAMCIKMLEILNTGKIYKVSEIADILETNSRNIGEYRKELEECGYYIETIPGRYGGYKLKDNSIIPSLKLTEEEKEAIIDGFNILMSKKDFLKKNLYSKAIGKIASRIELPEDNENLMIVDHYLLSMNEKDINDRFHFIDKAIKEKRVISIDYSSIKNGNKTHILHPYKLFNFNNAWFFLAYSPEVGEVWYFKINRIKNYKMLDETFKVWKNFKAEDYFDANGFKNNGEFIHVKFIAKGIRKQLVKERIYGKNQKVEENDDDTVTVTLDMQNEDQVVYFILGWGEDVTLLEPQSIIDKVKNIASEIAKKY